MSTRKLLIFLSVSLFVSIVLFAHIPYADQIITRRLAKPPQITKAKEVLKERTNVGMDITKKLINHLIDNGYNKPFEQLTKSLSDKLKKEGLSIFLFEDDELIFWSENKDITHLEEHSDFFVRVQNSWCISYWIARDNIKGLLLVDVKYVYPYQNQFLNNKFHGSLSFLEGYSVSSTSLNGSFPINLFSPVPVFYLSYIPRDFAQVKENYIALVTRIAFSFLLLAIFTLFWFPLIRKRGFISLIVLTVLLVGLRLGSLYWVLFPQGTWQLFGPEIFAFSWMAPSLGDFLLNSLIVFALAVYAFRVLVGSKIAKRTTLLALAIGLGILSLTTLLFIDSLLSILVQNSTVTLEAFQIFDLSIYSVLEYLSISLWFVTSILLLYVSVKLLSTFSKRTFWGLFLLSLVVALVLFFVIGGYFPFYGVALALPVIILISKSFSDNQQLKANTFLILVFLFSVFSVIIVLVNSDEKDKEIRKLLAINLADERDPIAEVMFSQLARRMHADEDIIYFLDNISLREGMLIEHLNDHYMSGYLHKYDFQVTVCFSTSNLLIEKTGEVVGCYSFFEEMLNDYGMRIPGTSFFHLNNHNGRISYLGMIEYVLPDGEEICIYLELDSQLRRELLGYPELLLDGALTGKTLFSNYSSAKYYNQQLIARTGAFSYPLVNQLEADSVSRYAFVDFDDYNHMIYKSEGDIMLLLSRPKVNMLNITASFAWVFLFFYIMLMFWLSIARLPVALNLNIPSFKNRIKFTMVLVLILSLLLVGSVTIAYSVKSFEKKNYENLNEKLLSVRVDIEKNMVQQDMLTPEYSDYLTHYLIELSNIFHSDINLYDTSGYLIASSRPEVFERQLQGLRINPLAWTDLSIKHSAKLVHKEQIGSMDYLSAYSPIIDVNNQLVAYLNLPYFTRQGEFMHEVFSVIVALVNIYALLILFAIFIAVVISNRITKPLELIREKLGSIDITKHLETISYNSRDEVGQLVNEYNKMVGELAESASKLAQSQRQSAWREMAKQIAHEIKNPLTPIKLNLQLLVKAKKENEPGWEKLFDKFSESLIDQINALSNIATEFSNFAKMPVGNFTRLSLNPIIDDAITLFSAYPNIKLQKAPNNLGKIFVFADKEQLHRVFVNLIKNAVQAIGREREGNITISISRKDEAVVVEVQDDGQGIHPDLQEKLFSPNFTTKSGGMGLGLAISKGIVEVIGGSIWFETQFGKGSKFFVELPISDEAEK